MRCQYLDSSHGRSKMFINLNSSQLRSVKYDPNTLMEPRRIRSVVRPARTRGLALLGAARTLLLVHPLLLGIAMYVESFVHDENY